jgi:hypothetical protein
MENRSLRMCARHWLQSFRYGDPMSSSCPRWHQGRYVTLFTEGLSRPFSCSTSSGTIILLEKLIIWVFPSLIFMFQHLTPRIHCSEATLQFAENTTFVFLCRVNISIIREKSKMNSRCHGGIIYIWSVQYWGKDGTLKHPRPLCFLA